ncbi:hypothetical protein [Limnobaculum parvum]|uniref:Uncharacterized protein n=1 Tax=Limnobaculum parvum TaxID=2172103 RepID=A0A2Y9TWB1_9GAMM|nr:hypothetical protein [Limnobaculum parvum]AWH87906.1 hypothetical protein HYN51_04630 [Limnobaculum parvum]
MTAKIEKDIKEKIIIRDSDIRRLNFYVTHMKDKNKLFDFYSLTNTCESINRNLSIVYEEIIKRKEFVDEMRAACNKVILPKKEFNWIKINDRNCFWAWLMIKDIRSELLPFHTNELYSSSPILYDKLPINQIPTNTKERYKAIIDFFDILRIDIQIVRNYFYNLKIRLRQIYQFSTSFNWLKKEDKEQCKWAWEYIKRSGIIINNEKILIPFSKKEMYFTIIAAFDSWPVLDVEKELFLIKMRKAWSQKKYRDDVSDKKLLNTYISKEAKKKLDIMTKINKKKINEIIELMIDNEYDKYQ